MTAAALLRLAWRESRTARRRLALYMSSIAFGVAALVAIDSFAGNVTGSIRDQSRTLLGGTMLADTDDGILARTPEEATWARLPTLIDGGEVHPRVTDVLALEPRRLLAATPHGVIASSDAGVSWTQPALGR